MKHYFKKSFVLLVACFFAGLSQTAAQNNFYVATTGSNANAGTDASAPKQTIMAAFYAAAAGDIINVAAGTYIETDPIYLNKSITIKGSNAGLPALGWTNSETIIRPKATNFADGSGDAAVVQMVASNITLDGIAIYGDNSTLSDATPRVINAVSSRANYGVMAYNNLSSLKVLNCKFANFVHRGISWAIYDANTIASGNNEIKNCIFDNIVRTNEVGTAIYLASFIAEVSNNTVTRTDRGLFYEINASVAHTAPLLAINNNSFAAYFRGIAMYGNGDAVFPSTEIKTNTLTWQDISGRSGDGITPTATNTSRGISVERVRGTSPILVQNNNVTNYNDGIAALSVEKTGDLNRMTIQGGTITNAGNAGILVDNYINQWASRTVIKGVTILNAGNMSVSVSSNGNSYNSEAALSDGMVLQKDLPITSNYNNAIYVTGSKAILTELGNTKITNAKFRFINLDNSAMQGLEVDGTAMTFDGEVNGYTFSNYTPGLSNDNAIAIALQERIRDKNPYSFGQDATTSGLIKFNLNVLPVALTEFNAKGTVNGTFLTWKTSSEKNNSHFIIARSNDGKNFTPISNIKGNGTSDSENTYNYMDKGFIGNAYYLLKQVDNNGRTTEYGEKIRFVKGLETLLTVYPNPTSDFLNVEITSKNTDVVIYDLKGKSILKLRSQPIGKLVVDVKDLPIGSYVLAINDGISTKNEKFIKK